MDEMAVQGRTWLSDSQNNHGTQQAIDLRHKWFGEDGNNGTVERLLSDMEVQFEAGINWIYPANNAPDSECRRNVAAYVYAWGDKKTQGNQGRRNIYVCSLFFNSGMDNGAMIGLILHEVSHHCALTFRFEEEGTLVGWRTRDKEKRTTDETMIVDGRVIGPYNYNDCLRMAMADSSTALNNAQNYMFYFDELNNR